MSMSFITLDFPREVLEITSDGQKGYRRLVSDWESLERYWKGKNGSGDVYFTAYGYRALTPPKNHRVDYNTPIIRHFVMDFDCKNFRKHGEDVSFEVMHGQVKNLHSFFLEKDITHYIWFSGGGFHVWVPLKKTYTPSNGIEVTRIKDGGRKLLSDWHKKFNLFCNDPTVAFDTAGMIRIPNSFNSKRGCWTIPLHSSEILESKHEDLWEISQEYRSGYIQHGNKQISIQPPKKKKGCSKNNRKPVDLPEISLDKMLVLPCLAQSAMGPGNPIHKARLHFVSYLASRLRWFFPPETISLEEKQKHVKQLVKICEAQGWVDFDENITRTQVESIVIGGAGNNGYSPAMCRTLIHDGLCTGKCKYYDGTAEGIL